MIRRIETEQRKGRVTRRSRRAQLCRVVSAPRQAEAGRASSCLARPRQAKPVMPCRVKSCLAASSQARSRPVKPRRAEVMSD